MNLVIPIRMQKMGVKVTEAEVWQKAFTAAMENHKDMLPSAAARMADDAIRLMRNRLPNDNCEVEDLVQLPEDQ